MKKDDVLINDTLWTNTGRGKVQVKVKQRIEGDRKGARVKFRVENLSTGKTLLRDPAALHKTRNFLEGEVRLPVKEAFNQANDSESTEVQTGPFCSWDLCKAPLLGPPRQGCGSPYAHGNGTWIGGAP